MGWWRVLTDSSDTVGKVTDAVINTGDKLFYTDEEKAEMKNVYAESLPTILKSYEPFKIAQRVLAFWFSFLFGMAFLTGLAMSFANIIIKYNALKDGVALDKIILLDIEPLFALVGAFSLGIIMIAIVSFYFGGGVIDSIKRKQ